MRLFDPTELYTDAIVDRGVAWRKGTVDECNPLLASSHYLGPLTSGSLIFVGSVEGEIVAAQVWRRNPTARRLPQDGTWLELARWCLTPAAGENGGSRMHRHAVRWLKREVPAATTLLSYSDPSQGHTGALYRSCNWVWRPTWHRILPPPTGNGCWSEGERQEVKDRWVFVLKPDARRQELLSIKYETARVAYEDLMLRG